MSSRLFFLKPKYLQIGAFLAAVLFSQVISATQMGSQWTDMAAGSTAIISLDPPLPRRGEPFTIEISGTWRNRCIDWFENLDVHLNGQTISITSWRNWSLPECGDEYEPTPFTRSTVIPSSMWASIDEKKPLVVRLNLAQGLNVFHLWFRKFDLTLGLHEIPPQIGQGHWISDQRPFQGLNVEQQADTVLLYELGYHRSDGKPNWLMANARFNGDVTHGVAYDVNWLNPSSELDRDMRDLVQPNEDEMSFTHSSFGIDVVGVNQIKVFFGTLSFTETYKRYVFRLADNQLPVVVPNMAGQWNLYAFDNQDMEASFLVEFRAGTKSDKGLGWYQFKSIDDQWVLDCWANLEGVGTCNLTNEDLGIAMSYDLVDFNGNYAKAPLHTSNTGETPQTGVLLREGFQLPVLDLQ